MSKHDPFDLTANLLGDEEAERRKEMVTRADKGRLTAADKAWLRENHITLWERKRGRVYEATNEARHYQ